jgi:hypothetical protein
MYRKPLIGRKIVCNKCAHKTVKGAARVFGKLLFFFCPRCWANRLACEELMRKCWEPTSAINQ